jgi:hypothetical protein
MLRKMAIAWITPAMSLFALDGRFAHGTRW